VYEELRRRKSILIKGNHESVFLNYLDFPSKEIDNKYGLGFKKYAKTFSNELIEYIKKIPLEYRGEIDGVKFGLFHGSNFDPDYYVYPTEKRLVLNKFAKEKSNIIFIGHCHYPFMFTCDNKIIISVGSVGQSRVVGGIANWGIYDTENKVYIPKNTPYDVNAVISKLEKDDADKYLKKVLTRNNVNYE